MTFALKMAMARFPVFFGLLSLGVFLQSGWAQSQDSLSFRLERIQGMLRRVNTELDSLRGDLKRMTGESNSMLSDSGTTLAAKEKAAPIFSELLSERQRKLAQASASSYQKTAMGYSLDPNVRLGMNLVNWTGPWGAKLEATARFSPDWRLAGLNLSLLRSLHRFSVFEGLQTHLYAFTGLGGFWQRMDIYGTSFITAAPDRKWFEVPDVTATMKLGVGSELGLYFLGGLQFTPEIGLRATRFFNRYQDSESWKSQSLTPGDKPKSDFSLDAYFGIHLYFYFR